MAVVMDFIRIRSLPFRRKSCDLPPDLAPTNYGICRPNEAFVNAEPSYQTHRRTPSPPVVISSYSAPVQVPILSIPKPRKRQKMESQGPKITLVELFQSQGCSSCPPANANVIELANNYPSILLLTYEVTYWDWLGWKDTFGNKSFDERQRDYADKLGNESVYTPQIVVNGRADGIGNTFRNLNQVVSKGVVAAANEDLTHVNVETDGDSILISGGAMREPADVMLVRYRPTPDDVDIRRGENSGRCLPHRNVVLGIAKIGEWQGGSIVFNIGDESEAGVSRAVLLQKGRGGPVIGVAKFM